MDSPKILLIEPNKKESQVLSKLLEERGYNVSCVYNSKDALEEAEETRFDLIILEPNMPDARGDKLFIDLKNIDRQREAPVLALSENDDIDYIEDFLKKGIADYIIKPYRQSYLISRIESYIH